MCNCLKEVEQKGIERCKEVVSKSFKIREINDGESGFVNKALMFDQKGGYKLIFPFELKYTFTKKDGTASNNKTYKTNIFPSFCPFCGKKMDTK